MSDKPKELRPRCDGHVFDWARFALSPMATPGEATATSPGESYVSPYEPCTYKLKRTPINLAPDVAYRAMLFYPNIFGPMSDEEIAEWEQAEAIRATAKGKEL